MNVNNLPASVLHVKQMISDQTGIPVRDQNLYEYPEYADQGPGLRLYADNHIFNETMRDVEINFVLTLGKVSSWTYFYLSFHINLGSMALVKCWSHRLSTVADLKRRFPDLTGLPAYNYDLSFNSRKYDRFDEKWNIYQCGVQNGSNLYVAPLGKLPR